MKVDWRKFENKFEIDDWTLARLRSYYPFFDQELIKMEIWYIANPKKQKKNHYRFIVSWLNRVKEKQVGRVSRDYRRDDIEFKEKMEQAVKEIAPPPSEWRQLMDRLKPKGI